MPGEDIHPAEIVTAAAQCRHINRSGSFILDLDEAPALYNPIINN